MKQTSTGSTTTSVPEDVVRHSVVEMLSKGIWRIQMLPVKGWKLLVGVSKSDKRGRCYDVMIFNDWGGWPQAAKDRTFQLWEEIIGH